ncbi:hypothetical protein F2P81_023557 [Scophthalmus maximus]|uniref:Uncharacterized protein n=1 Tax=Scophthalmus maximus TaxID=52904 RepID=A0A6A4RXB3_SCOMX|nr:hypothetical protein F2P81_023557 [Scophthalmus maximus]
MIPTVTTVTTDLIKKKQFFCIQEAHSSSSRSASADEVGPLLNAAHACGRYRCTVVVTAAPVGGGRGLDEDEADERDVTVPIVVDCCERMSMMCSLILLGHVPVRTRDIWA